MARINYIYCDSCVFLAYLNAEVGRVAILDKLFENIKHDSTSKLITSTLTIAEVTHTQSEKNKRTLKIDLEKRLDKFWSDENLREVVDVNEIIVREARRLIRLAIQEGYSLKPPDAIHLATAQLLKVTKFITYDDLSRYARWVTYTIQEPTEQI
ncbi:MAG: type II toxin-antitoxin system VapC family toxin [Anaerolineae bacterium]|nr:type II toxin-antitoxin system VapC family toxin [Anaerolineae bacterium]